MIRKRSWITLLAIPVCLISVLIIGAQKSHPANAGGVIDPTCTSSFPCIEYDNNGTGPGVRGISFNGNGLGGETEFNSTSASNGKAGIEGDDSSASGAFNSGVHGFSARGTGVLGTSTTGTGVSGASNSVGIMGTTTTAGGIGVEAVAGGAGIGVGLKAVSGSGDAINALANNGAAVDAFNNGGGSEVGRFTTGSSGGEAFIATASGVGVVATGFAKSPSTAPALNATCFHDAPAMTATSFVASKDIMSLDCSGNMILSGLLTTSGTPLVARRSAAGMQVATFSAQQTTQTMEDIGEAQLIGGRASIRLAPDFAATIDRRANYLVFITPQGDSRGLYVTMKTPAGFEVRENGSGNATLAFDYRIVAKPYGEASRRLPAVRTLMRPDSSVMRLMQQAGRTKAQPYVR